jgi:hypothetical protein
MMMMMGFMGVILALELPFVGLFYLRPISNIISDDDNDNDDDDDDNNNNNNLLQLMLSLKCLNADGTENCDTLNR